jgi:hypothetical protein
VDLGCLVLPHECAATSEWKIRRSVHDITHTETAHVYAAEARSLVLIMALAKKLKRAFLSPCVVLLLQ